MIDWDDLRFFLSIARRGSLTGAAKELRVAQSTVGRRLTSLEASLGVRLLHRTPDGYVLTLAGENVRAQVERVEAEVIGVERTVGGRDARLEGIVRVTCTETFAAHILASCFTTLQVRHPGISIELVPDFRELSLSMREADIAVRLTRSDQNDLVIRSIGRVAFGLYASPDYLKRRGLPDFASGCSGHSLLMLLDSLESASQARWLESLTSKARLGLQTTSHEALLSAALSGGGLCCLARFRADPHAGLRRLATPTAAPATEIYLVVHKDSRSIPRIKVALAAVAESVKRLSLFLDPTDVN